MSQLLLNSFPFIKTYGNGFQLTFENLYSIVVKVGIGTKSTQTKKEDSEILLASRFGGNASPDMEVEIYSPNKINVSEKFGEIGSLGNVTTNELAQLIHIVSNLR